MMSIVQEDERILQVEMQKRGDVQNIEAVGRPVKVLHGVSKLIAMLLFPQTISFLCFNIALDLHEG